MPFLNLDTDSFHLRTGGNKILVIWYEQVDWALTGGSVAEPLERWTCNSEAPRSSPTLTASWINLFKVVPVQILDHACK